MMQIMNIDKIQLKVKHFNQVRRQIINGSDYIIRKWTPGRDWDRLLDQSHTGEAQ